MRILLVEDDNLLGDGLRTALSQERYAVDWARDGQEADLALRDTEYELVVLDLMLPRIDGVTLLRNLRERSDATPVLVLSARDTVNDRVEALDVGADDYLIKPFELDELLARVRALLRRRSGRAQTLIHHNDLEIDPAAHQVTRAGEVIELTPREFAVLQLLLDNRGRVMSRSRLEEGLYPWDREVGSNAIEVHIHHLRKKLGSGVIRTIRGVGYIVERKHG